MTTMSRLRTLRTWGELGKLAGAGAGVDRVQGPTNSQANLRLFGGAEGSEELTLYRDHHAWCPYCHKVWLWLEEKRVPYRVRKVTMFCYGEKEAWYRKICPSGMLPAVQFRSGEVVTDSDQILRELEARYGPLGVSLGAEVAAPLRRLERQLFSAWCGWLCYPGAGGEDARARHLFTRTLGTVDQALRASPGPYFLDTFSVVDCLFAPFLERMVGSLYYYKGFVVRDPSSFPGLAAWFQGMEGRTTYRGTQGDAHTHAHDLPPQLGGCYASGTREQEEAAARVDRGLALDLPDCGYPEPEQCRAEAASRVIRHKDYIIAANPGQEDTVDEALRAALTLLLTGEGPDPPPGSAAALRYVRARVSVPRDMGPWAARRLRQALELTAARDGEEEGAAIPTKHRRDQDPRNFGK